MKNGKKPIYIYECCSCGQHIATTDPKKLVVIYCSYTGDSAPACTACKAISDATHHDEKLLDNFEHEGEDVLSHPDTMDAGRAIARMAVSAEVDDTPLGEAALSEFNMARVLIDKNLVEV